MTHHYRFPAALVLCEAMALAGMTSAATREPPPSGFKRIEAALQIKGLARFSGYRFFIFPAHHEGGALPVEFSVPFTYDQSAGGVLYAIKGDRPPPQDMDRTFFERHPEVVRGDRVRMRELVPVSEPVDRIVTVFRIDSISGGRIHMHLVRHIQYRTGDLIAATSPSPVLRQKDKPDNARPVVPPPSLPIWVLILLPLSIVVFVALLVLRKRRRARPTHP